MTKKYEFIMAKGIDAANLNGEDGWEIKSVASHPNYGYDYFFMQREKQNE